MYIVLNISVLTSDKSKIKKKQVYKERKEKEIYVYI